MVPPVDAIPPIGATGAADGGQPIQAGQQATSTNSQPLRQPSPVEPPRHGPPHTLDLSLDPQAVRRMPSDVYVRYYVSRGIGNYVVQVVDRRTGEVIREIPPGRAEAFLRELGML
jgi:hypothetical protein